MLRTKDTSFKNFGFIANTLLNQTQVCVTGTNSSAKYQLCEIEFYYNGDGHTDKYTHGNKDQLTKCKFYFHKYANGTYKSGTYMGCDITLSPDNKTYFGVLIRSIRNIETGEFIEGPCKCVREFFRHFNCTSVSEFMNGKTSPLDVYDTPELHLTHDPIKQKDVETVYKARRIGLADEKYPEWRSKNYRCATLIKNIKKERKQFVEIDDFGSEL
jgi:hypothetical protein